jgi:RNA polymerase sigma-70 factor, ECF subfamily
LIEGGSGHGNESMSEMVERLTAITLPANSEMPVRESDDASSRSVARSNSLDAEFAARMSETRQVVFRVAYSVLREAADAEEIAQDAFLRAYGHIRELREPQKFKAWICRIAFRLALNRKRAHGRRLVRDTAWHGSRGLQNADGARIQDEREYLERLRNEIERLPKKLRSVVLLTSVSGMDATEVGAVLEVPAGTVRSRLHLARKRLVEVMER